MKSNVIYVYLEWFDKNIEDCVEKISFYDNKKREYKSFIPNTIPRDSEYINVFW